MENERFNTDLAIIGGGAAGLMAACTAAELGLKGVLIERKNRPGRKMLLCGNNRCNLTADLSPGDLLSRYGTPVGPFLGQAIADFPPRALRDWFRKHRLPTAVQDDGRVYPRSQKADDVLHSFTDFLRDRSFPLLLNCPVKALDKNDQGFMVVSDHVRIASRSVLLATGGVSYPKTGSVGDGQKFAKALGHKVTPYRPGLVGFEVAAPWLRSKKGGTFPACQLTITAKGKTIASTEGDIVCGPWGLRGRAIVDASRIVARRNLRDYSLVVDLCPGMTAEQLAAELLKRSAGKPKGLSKVLTGWLLPRNAADGFVRQALHADPGKALKPDDNMTAMDFAGRLKQWALPIVKPRPLKEAMVTVGGIDLAEIDPATMESRRCPGLYVAGEVMDIDGPTGGTNLQAAFSTARLAVQHIAANG